jgi:hypothetical protein
MAAIHIIGPHVRFASHIGEPTHRRPGKAANSNWNLDPSDPVKVLPEASLQIFLHDQGQVLTILSNTGLALRSLSPVTGRLAVTVAHVDQCPHRMSNPECCYFGWFTNSVRSICANRIASMEGWVPASMALPQLQFLGSHLLPTRGIHQRLNFTSIGFVSGPYIRLVE